MTCTPSTASHPTCEMRPSSYAPHCALQTTVLLVASLKYPRNLSPSSTRRGTLPIQSNNCFTNTNHAQTLFIWRGLQTSCSNHSLRSDSCVRRRAAPRLARSVWRGHDHEIAQSRLQRDFSAVPEHARPLIPYAPLIRKLICCLDSQDTVALLIPIWRGVPRKSRISWTRYLLAS